MALECGCPSCFARPWIPIIKCARNKLPRIWWMTNGLLGMATLHAAGSNWGRSRENIAAHVVSSYTPTFKSLKYAGEKSLQSLPWPEQKFLAAVMPETPSFGDSNSLSEVSAIEENVARSGIPRQEGRRAARPHRQQHGPLRLPRRIRPGRSTQQLPPAEEWT